MFSAILTREDFAMVDVLAGVVMILGSYYFWTGGRRRRLIGKAAIMILYLAPAMGVYVILMGLFG